ncbi:MAG: 50S ribosomal protein L1 [Patescibacteria group bacterium]|nr:50S ribosomal protein L1 [Patescibacteria group bacterium]
MKKPIKKKKKVYPQIEKGKTYSIEEAIKLVKETTKAKFDESLEIHVHLGVDTSKGEQQVRSTVVLPAGSGKTKKIVVFTENEKEALEAGADIAGGKELINKIKTSGVIDFEVAVATPSMMKELAGVAKILGPKGLMPSPKNETVTTNIKKAVSELKGGKVAFKSDDTGNIHQLIGKVSWDASKLKSNVEAFMEAVRKAKPASAKGDYIKKVVICSTMGPGVRIAI